MEQRDITDSGKDHYLLQHSYHPMGRKFASARWIYSYHNVILLAGAKHIPTLNAPKACTTDKKQQDLSLSFTKIRKASQRPTVTCSELLATAKG